MDGDVVRLCGIQREQRCELITKGTCGVRTGCCLGLGKIPDFGRFWAKFGPLYCSFRINSPRKKGRLSPEFFYPALLLVEHWLK